MARPRLSHARATCVTGRYLRVVLARNRWLRTVILALASRPSLWSTAVRQTAVLAVHGWWRRAPFLPLPDRAYLRFRMQTMYGDADRFPEPADVVAYLQWCRAWPGTDLSRRARRPLR